MSAWEKLYWLFKKKKKNHLKMLYENQIAVILFKWTFIMDGMTNLSAGM